MTAITSLFFILFFIGCSSSSNDEFETVIVIENNAPVANNDNATTTSNVAITIELFATDNNGDTLIYSIDSQPENGATSLTGATVTYTPTTDFIGEDSLTFTANDGQVDSNIATISITINEALAMTTLSDGTEVSTLALISLGDQVYNDTNLSSPIGQACASCHGLSNGFDEPNDTNPTSIGADLVSFGGRNSPTASYAAHIPNAQMQNGPGGVELIGGLFIDGRALNLEEQAKGPFLNPIEMGNASEADVITKISSSSYASEFETLFGNDILADSERSYNYLADAIAAFERTELFSPFTSKFDQVQAGTTIFTAAEQRGQDLFRNKGDCERCHRDNANVIVFSDFSYKNIGVPSNPLLPAFMNDASFIDLGLGAESGDNRNNGQFRVSNLRNISITAPYMHNGVFNTLREVIEFYNTRDTTFSDAPEVTQNVDQGGLIGELNLTNNEVDDLIAFMNTFTDQ